MAGVMGGGGAIFICILIVIMDVIAGILGIEAEVAQSKAANMKVFIFECKEPVYEAYKLGVAAAALLAVAHALANLLGGCICITSQEEYFRSSINRRLASWTLVLSWIALVVGFTLLLAGALANAKTKATCGFAHRHFLSVGGILCFVHGIVTVAYYVNARASVWEGGYPTVHRDVSSTAGATTQVV
ncbi:hypothetical protein LUZ62_063083 [Rhynchospora pubera]|uniref:Uncharacterized protein n=1 Tax=Rhynchospora pubera TaxID=906938 RepID=A0AAV8EKU4_9POAL|nr:hypothetical protein LUZ62_063083 [Rhynchospora pubera]